MAKPTPVAPAVETAGFEYVAVDVPESTRGATNPHTDKVRALNEARLAGKPSAAAFLIPASDEATQKRAVAREVRHLQDAGTSLGITVRKVTTRNDDGSVRVTFWPVDKISRKSSDASAASVTG